MTSDAGTTGCNVLFSLRFHRCVSFLFLMTDTHTQNTDMAPEVMERDDYDEKVDIFSFGMLLFFMLFAIQPFGHLKRESFLSTITSMSPFFL